MKKYLLIFMLAFLVVGCFNTTQKDESVPKENSKIEQTGYENFFPNETEIVKEISKSPYVSNLITNIQDKRVLVMNEKSEIKTSDYKDETSYNTILSYELLEKAYDAENNRIVFTYKVSYAGEKGRIVEGTLKLRYEFNKTNFEKYDAEFMASETNEDDHIAIAKREPFPAPYTRTLFYTTPYMTGEDVKTLQSSLNKYFKLKNINITLTTDGVFGNYTKAAVLKFQQGFAELTANAVFDAKTAKVLIESIKDNTVDIKAVIPSQIFVGENTFFSGTNTSNVKKIKATVDNNPITASYIDSSNGSWSFSYKFSGTGYGRNMVVTGYDAAGSELKKVNYSINVLTKNNNNLTTIKEEHDYVNGKDKVQVWRAKGKKPFFFKAKLAIDGDGAYRAYHPDNIGLDYLANAGHPGNWWALATDTGDETGNPIKQGPNDPAPGYYISMTSLEDRTKPVARRYVDSESIPFIVLPDEQRMGAKLGDFGVAINSENGKMSYVIFADTGPDGKLGEGSIALAKALGINSSPKNGGTEIKKVVYVVFPGSGNAKPRTIQEINDNSKQLFEAWGGLEQLKKLGF